MFSVKSSFLEHLEERRRNSYRDQRSDPEFDRGDRRDRQDHHDRRDRHDENNTPPSVKNNIKFDADLRSEFGQISGANDMNVTMTVEPQCVPPPPPPLIPLPPGSGPSPIRMPPVSVMNPFGLPSSK